MKQANTTVTCPHCGATWNKDDLEKLCSNCFSCTGCEMYDCPQCRKAITIKPIRPLRSQRTGPSDEPADKA